MKFWLILALFMLGCSEDRTYHGSTAFSLDERARILAGNEWIASKMGREPFDIVWDSNGNERLRIDRGPVPGAVGRYWASGRIGLDVDAAGTYLVELSAHEFGHAHGYTGFHHGGRGIMSTSEVPVLEWTEEDEASCSLACSR